jgi:hypothetical protein
MESPDGTTTEQQAPVPETPEQCAERVLDLQNLGASPVDVVRHARQTGISGQQISRAMKDGEALLAKAAPALLAREPDIDKRHAMMVHHARLSHLFARTMQNAEHSTARAVLADIATLLNLNPPRQEIHTRELGTVAASIMRATLASEANREAIASLTHQEYGRRPDRAPVVEVSGDEGD